MDYLCPQSHSLARVSSQGEKTIGKQCSYQLPFHIFSLMFLNCFYTCHLCPNFYHFSRLSIRFSHEALCKLFCPQKPFPVGVSMHLFLLLSCLHCCLFLSLHKSFYSSWNIKSSINKDNVLNFSHYSNNSWHIIQVTENGDIFWLMKESPVNDQFYFFQEL